MKCPFELPVKKRPDFNNKDLFRVESADGLFLSFSLKEDEVDYIVHAINSHEKLAQYKEYVESRINECKVPNKWMPLYFSEWDKCVSDLAKDLEQALKETEKP